MASLRSIVFASNKTFRCRSGFALRAENDEAIGRHDKGKDFRKLQTVDVVGLAKEGFRVASEGLEVAHGEKRQHLFDGAVLALARISRDDLFDVGSPEDAIAVQFKSVGIESKAHIRTSIKEND